MGTVLGIILLVVKSWDLSFFNFCFILEYSWLTEKAMATHSRTLAWRIPGTVEPGGLPCIGLHRVGHDWSDLAAAAAAWLINNVLISGVQQSDSLIHIHTPVFQIIFSI